MNGESDDRSRIDALTGSYSDALLHGDIAAADQVVTRAMSAGLSARDVYLDLVLPSLSAVGDMWHAGKLNAADEHVATQTSLHVVEHLSARTEPGRPRSVRAVVAAVAGEWHFVGARIFAEFLRMDGWEVEFLGADTPTEDLGVLVKGHGADLVVLSVTLSTNLPVAMSTARHLQSLGGGWKTMVAGPGTVGVDAKGPVQGVATDMKEALALASSLVGLDARVLEIDDVLGGLGLHIVVRRKELGMTQADLAAGADLDRAYISAVERGKQNISVAALVRLATALEVEPRALLPS